MGDNWEDDMTLPSALGHVASRTRTSLPDQVEDAANAYRKLYYVPKEDGIQEYCERIQRYRKTRPAVPQYLQHPDGVMMSEAFTALKRHYPALASDPIIARGTHIQEPEDLPRMDKSQARLIQIAPALMETYKPPSATAATPTTRSASTCESRNQTQTGCPQTASPSN
ncbi:uncharacterized protein BROUX77_006025 [Berkeleyomyces rouxiae]|uniref:uncharacterized protein n=1 Tax=Berkeleyomyces rouxiae TaxID=2035830 RepID=UPI003B7618F3